MAQAPTPTISTPTSSATLSLDRATLKNAHTPRRTTPQSPLAKSFTAPSLYSTGTSNKPSISDEDHVASFKKMLDDILDNASSESLSQGLETNLKSRIASTSSTSYLSASAAAAAAATAADRARLSRSTTLGFLLPQPKTNFAKLKESGPSTTAKVDIELLHKLEEQNSLLPPQESTSFLLARLERQHELLDTHLKSVCIESNTLKGNLDTLHRLIAESTTQNNTTESTTSDVERKANEEEIDWEFWGMLIQDYNAVASKLPHLLSARIRQGLPTKLRGLIWQSMSQASSTYLETMYTQLLKEHSPYERIIQRDLARTFPQVEMFKEEGGKGQEMLRNILKAYSLYDPHVGYCQGLGFLVGPLLMNMDEKEAFCVFVRLMETYDMRTMFTLNMEGLQLRLYQFSALLSEHLPMLHAHLSFHSIHAAMYASQWFLSLFAYTYPLPLVLRIYDVVFSEGAPETIMRVAVAFLRKNEERLMQLQEFEDLLDVLSSKLYDVYEDDAGSVIRDAMALSTEISKDKLDALAMTYLAELEDQQKRAGEVTSKRFKDRFGSTKAKPEAGSATSSPLTRQVSKPKLGRAGSRLSIAASFGSSVSLVLSSSDEEDGAAMPQPSRSNAGSDNMLLDQIQDLAKALSALQRDHVEVTEGLVSAKMEKTVHLEEIETLRKKVKELERQQNRVSTMSAIAPSVASVSEVGSSVTSPRTYAHEDSRMRHQPGHVRSLSSGTWSTHSQDDCDKEEGNTSSVSSLNVSQDDLPTRLASLERELAHVTSELVHTKVSAMEAMNDAESQRTKAQSLGRILLDSREAVVMLQDQQMVLQNTKMTMAMEMDTLRHERDSFEREMNVMRQQFEETKRLWLEGQVERHTLQEKVKELEMNAAFAASSSNLNRGRSVRKSLGEATMMSLMTSRSGSPSPLASAPMSPVSEEAAALPPVFGKDLGRRGSSESLETARLTVRRGSSDTQGSGHSNGGRESTSTPRPAAMVRKGWPSEKAANAGVVPSAPATTIYGTRKFIVAEGTDTKLKRSQSNRNSWVGSLSFRRSTSEAS